MNAKRKVFLLLWAVFCCLQGVAQIPGSFATYGWATAVFALPSASPIVAAVAEPASAVDLQGNIYVANRTRGFVQINNQTYVGEDSFTVNSIIKYTPSGTVGWVKRFGTGPFFPDPGFDIRKLVTDNDGNLYAAGDFINVINIEGNFLATPFSSRDYFVAKWDPNGALIWIKKGGAPGFRIANTLAVDAGGNVFIGGSYTGTSGFGGQTLTPPNNSANSFVAQLNPGGDLVWAISSGGGSNSQSQVNNLGLDQTGNIYLQGTFSNSLSWGAQTVTASLPGTGVGTTFWAKLSATGGAQQLFAMPQVNTSNTTASMVVDAAGNSFVSNQFSNSVDLGGITLTPNYNTGIYVAKYNSSGVLQWANAVKATLGPNLTQLLNRNLALDNQGKLYLAGNFKGNFSIDSFEISGAINTFSAFAACFDQFTGNAFWALQSASQGNVNDNYVAASGSGYVALTGNFSGGPVNFGGNTAGDSAQTQLTSFYVTRILQNYNVISGRVFVDENLSGFFDPGEQAYVNSVVVEVNPGAAAFNTTPAGTYSVLTGSGTSTVAITSPPPYYNAVAVVPPSATFTGTGNFAGNRDFALQPVANQQDLQVFVTPLMAVRPGFTTTYRVTYKNVGTVLLPSGTISLTFDPLLTYLSSSPAGSIAGSTLSWSYSNLAPNQSRNINIVLSVPASATLGDFVTFSATVNPVSGDLTPADNSETITREITGSFDPNKIDVNLNEITPQQLLQGEWLYYTIHFQNLGSDTAFTVMLRDSLPTDLLKLNTIQLVAASHSHVWSLGPNGMLTVTYNNIRLPHQGINSIGSHGFVRFRIKPQPALVVGDVIPNRARIYFDYNPYIATNIASTEVTLTGAAPGNLEQNWLLYPNPASGILIVESARAQSGNIVISITNTLGQEVAKTSASAGKNLFRQELDLLQLPKGIYVVTIKTDAGIVNMAVVRQ